jgi:predicted short-subunit dehydrogenase-like oxidoreductase (DUF2520 family)
MAAAAAQEVVDASDLVFLTVPDSAIGSVAGSLTWGEGQFVAHCSGALGLDVLERAAGTVPGGFHPLQTFPSRTPESERFEGVFVGVEGAEELGDLLAEIAEALGARPIRLEGVDRALYHAAAVVASNHVVALAAAAGRMWELAGLAPGTSREALAPLMNAATANIANMELPDALTGPVARGDVATVERHLDAIAAEPELAALYRLLSRELLRLPLQLPEEARAALTALLDGAARGSG